MHLLRIHDPQFWKINFLCLGILCGYSSIVHSQETALISGSIETFTGEKVENVNVTIGSDQEQYPATTITPCDGTYTFDNNFASFEYKITANKDDAYLNGVTTRDLILIQRHILGLEQLDSPYQLIAADVNSDTRVSAADRVQLNQLILGVTDELPANDSWRFVNKSQSFENIRSPFPFLESITIDNLEGALQAQDFVGVKIGDVDGSVIANCNQSIMQPTETLILEADDLTVNVGETVQVQIYSKDFIQVHAMQFTLNHKGLKLLNVVDQDINELQYSIITEGELATFTWSPSSTNPVTSVDALFTLEFEALETVQLRDVLTINSAVTTSIAYTTGELIPNNISLQVNDKNQNNDCSNIGIDFKSGDRISLGADFFTFSEPTTGDFSFHVRYLSNFYKDSIPFADGGSFLGFQGQSNWIFFQEMENDSIRLFIEPSNGAQYFQTFYRPDLYDDEFDDILIKGSDVSAFSTPIDIYVNGDLLVQITKAFNIFTFNIGLEGIVDEITLWDYELEDSNDFTLSGEELRGVNPNFNYTLLDFGIPCDDNTSAPLFVPLLPQDSLIESFSWINLFGFDFTGCSSNFVCLESTATCSIDFQNSGLCNEFILQPTTFEGFESLNLLNYSWSSPDIDFTSTSPIPFFTYEGDLDSIEFCLDVDDTDCFTQTCKTFPVQELLPPRFSNCQENISIEQCGSSLFFDIPTAISQCDGSQLDVTCQRVGGGSMNGFFPIGITTIICTTAANEMEAQCSWNVEVFDDVAPTCVSSDITISIGNDGSATTTTKDLIGESFDNCDPLVFDNELYTFNCNQLGDNQIAFEIADNSGNVSTCEAIVTVQDPSAVCVNEDCSVLFNWEQTGSCYEVNFTSEISEFPGSVTYTWTVDDRVFSLSKDFSYSFTKIAGTQICLSVTDGECEDLYCEAIDLELVPLSIIDGCDDITVSTNSETCNYQDYIPFINYTPTCEGEISLNFERSDDINITEPFPIGITTINASVGNTYGAQASCSFTITVVDETPPICATNDITISLDQDGRGQVFGDQLVGESSDNCAITLGDEVFSFDCTSLGTNDVSFFIFDDSGNRTTCNSTITVEDPLSACINDKCTINFDWTQDRNCYEVQFEANTSNFNGPITYQWYVDGALAVESESQSSFTFTPSSLDGPTICAVAFDGECQTEQYCEKINLSPGLAPRIDGCRDIELDTDPNTCRNEDFAPELAGIDRCNDLEVNIEYQRSDSQIISAPWPIGITEVNVIATDSYGVQNTCSFEVEVIDKSPPVCLQEDIFVTAEAGQDGAQVSYDLSFDDCSQISISDCNFMSGDLFPCGTTNVICTLIDEFNNRTECNFNIEVQCEIDACCNSSINIENAISNSFEVSSDFTTEANCKARVSTLPNIDCLFITRVDWGDDTYSEGMFMPSIDLYHFYQNSGEYEVCLTYAEFAASEEDCFTESVCETIVVSAQCQILKKSDVVNTLKVYPNPLSDLATVILPVDGDFSSLKIYDYRLSQKATINLQKIPKNLTVDFSTYQSGVYFIVIEKNGLPPLVKKVIKI